MSGWIIRLQAQRLEIVGLGLRMLSLLSQSVADIKFCGCKVGPEPQDGLIVRYRFFKLMQIGKSISEVQVSIRVFRSRFKRGVIIRDGFREFSECRRSEEGIPSGG